MFLKIWNWENFLLAYDNEKFIFNYLLAYARIKLWGDIKSMMNYRIDEDVKLIWELLNLSQKQFAERIGVDLITVVKW